MKKNQDLLIKTSIVIKVHKNHFQITIITLDNNHLTDLTIEDDLQIKKCTKFLTK